MADYGVTEVGFKAKRYEDIFSDIKTRFKTDLNIDLDRDPDMVSKLITNILTLPIVQSWSNTQTLQSMFDVDKATGVWLDNLASFHGITRSAGSYPRGRITINVSSPLTIPANQEFKSTKPDVFFNDSSVTISESSATKIVYSSILSNSTLKQSTVQVDGKTYSVNGTNPNNDSLIDLVYAINSDSSSVVTAGLEIVGAEAKLTLTSKSPYTKHSFNKGSIFSVLEMESYVEIRSDTLGEQVYSAGTVVVPHSFTAINSVINNEPIDNGAGEESDLELRQRIKLSRSRGKATVAFIKSNLLNVENVNSAIVLENDSEDYDLENNIPPKAFKCIVKGGSAEDIASTIWETKPAGISTAGDELVLVRDSENDLQSVWFSRVSDKYIHVEVRYSLYSEEEAPLDVESAIAEQVNLFGNSLGAGVDVIQGRIESAVYQNVAGLERVTVRIGATPSAQDPTPSLSSTNKISVNLSEEANFSLDRIVVLPA